MRSIIKKLLYSKIIFISTLFLLLLSLLPGSSISEATVSVVGSLTRESTVQIGQTYEGTILLKNQGEETQQVKLYQTDYLFFSNGTNLYTITNLDVNTLAVNPSSPSTVYAGTNNGVFKSTDGGESWSPTNAGLTNLPINTLAIDPLTPSTIYAGTLSGGVFKSSNGGETWRPTGLTDRNISSLAIDLLTPTTLYAGIAGTAETWGEGIFKSTDGGETWRPTGLTDRNIYTLAVDPTNPSTLYAGTRGGVFKSTDGGESWMAKNMGLINLFIETLAIDPSASSTVYAGTLGGGVFKSTDGGESWRAKNMGLTTLHINILTIDPTNSSTLYVGTRGGVFKSTDGGNSWEEVNIGLNNLVIYSLAIGPSAPSTVYAGTLRGGIFKSTETGTSWKEVNKLERSNANWLTFSPSRVEVPAKKTVLISYTLEIPDDKSLRGTYWSILMVEPLPEIKELSEGEQPQVVIRQIIRYGIQLVTHIGDTGIRKLKEPPSVKLIKGEKRVFQIDLENIGQRLLRPEVWLELYNEKGIPVGRFESGKKRIYPGTSVRHSIDLSELPKGKYIPYLIINDNEYRVAIPYQPINF